MAKTKHTSDPETRGGGLPLNPALADVQRQVDLLCVSMKEIPVKAMWDLGKVVTEVATHPEHYGFLANQGRKAVKALLPEHLKKQAQDTRRITLVTAKRFVATWKEEDKDLLLESGYGWDTVRHLTRLDDRGQRLALLKEACANNWKTAEIAKQVTALRGGKKSPGGRPIKLPTSLTPLIEWLQETLEFFDRKLEAAFTGDRSIYAVFAQTPKDGRTKVQMEMLKAVAAKFEEVALKMGDHSRDLVTDIADEIADTLPGRRRVPLTMGAGEDD